MRRICIVFCCAIAGMAVLHTLSAQGWERKGPPPNPYNTRQEVTVKGTIDSVVVTKLKEGNGTSNTTFLRFRNGVLAFIGPNWYIGDGMVFSRGDQVEILGARMVLQGMTVVAAKEVRKGTMTLILRDYEGRPYWDSGNSAVDNIRERPGRGKGGKAGGGMGGGPGGGMGGGM